MQRIPSGDLTLRLKMAIYGGFYHISPLKLMISHKLCNHLPEDTRGYLPFAKVPPILRYFDEAMAVYRVTPTAEVLLLSREPRHQFRGEVWRRHG